MIYCPICHKENTNLEIVCKNCGCYLQTKIENINLFEILWLLIENPQKGIKIVAIAKHKNFIFFLNMLFGISLLYVFYEILKLYDFLDKPFLIFVSGLVLGIPVGFLTILVLALVTFIFKNIFKLVNVKFKQIYTALTYSTIPLIYLLIFIFPIKLIVFGINTFSRNPSPMIINSLVYWIIFAISCLFVGYFIYLFIVSIIVLFELRTVKAILLGLLIISIISIGYFFLLNHFYNYISNL